jgi:Cu/Ag efflux protein CusF
MWPRTILSLVLLCGLVMQGALIGEAQQTPPPRPTTPPASAAPAPEPPQERQIEGTVSKVDPLAKTVGISTGLFGLLGATVLVGDDTQIRVDGKPGTLAEIKEGAKVKASYEKREGRNLAKSIDVMPAEAKSRPAA